MHLNTCEEVESKVSVSYGPITYFDNVQSPHPIDGICDNNDNNDDKFAHLYKLIVTGGAGLEARVTHIRKTLNAALSANPNAKEAKRAISGLKLGLPVVCVSGAFTQRRNEAIKEYSGLICIDIDDLRDNATQVRDRLSKDPYALLTFLSP